MNTQDMIQQLIDKLESEGIPICGTLAKLIMTLEDMKANCVLEETLADNSLKTWTYTLGSPNGQQFSVVAETQKEALKKIRESEPFALIYGVPGKWGKRILTP